MVKFQASLIREQGVEFGILIVKRYALQSRFLGDKITGFFQETVANVPIVLMAQDASGVPTYQGRDDLVKLLAGIDFERTLWKEYTIHP